MCLRCETAAVWSHGISLRTQEIFKCKGRCFPVSSRMHVDTQGIDLATAKDARSTHAAVHEYVVARGGDSG